MAKKEKIKKESFIKGTKNEMKKVIWPTGKQVLKFSIITLCMIGFFMIFFVLIDLLASFVKGMFI